MPAVYSNSLVKIGTVEGGFTECYSVGAQCFKLASNNLNKAQKKPKKAKYNPSEELSQTPAPNDELLGYYLVVFPLSFFVKHLITSKLGLSWAELTIKLDDGLIAIDGAPKMERHLKSVHIKYSYGTKEEKSSQLSFKLGWENKAMPDSGNATASVGEKLSNDYSVLLETEAIIRNCTIQFIKPLTQEPAWRFDRHQNEQILQDTREVWLMIQKKIENNSHSNVKVRLHGRFTMVREKEKTLDKLTGDQVRLYEKVFAAAIRTTFEKPEYKKEICFEINDLF